MTSNNQLIIIIRISIINFNEIKERLQQNEIKKKKNCSSVIIFITQVINGDRVLRNLPLDMVLEDRERS